MSKDTIYTDVRDVMGVTEIFRDLRDTGIAQFKIDEGRGPKRVVIALPSATEIMVAMEGSGCKFATFDDAINPFVFITDGFQLRAAQIITVILGGLARSIASAKRNQPLLEQRS